MLNVFHYAQPDPVVSAQLGDIFPSYPLCSNSAHIGRQKQEERERWRAHLEPILRMAERSVSGLDLQPG